MGHYSQHTCPVLTCGTISFALYGRIGRCLLRTMRFVLTCKWSVAACTAVDDADWERELDVGPCCDSFCWYDPERCAYGFADVWIIREKCKRVRISALVLPCLALTRDAFHRAGIVSREFGVRRVSDPTNPL
eukprot:2485157-Rhodomonas_salina.1